MTTTSLKCLKSLKALSALGLALTVALSGCNGGKDEQASSQQGPEVQPVSAEQPAGTPESKPAKTDESKAISTPADQAELAKELAESRKQALSKQEPVDPEVAKRMQDPDYRKKKDAMLNELSQISTKYFKQGIEIRHTRKRPEWRLIDPDLAAVSDPAQRRQQAETLATKFKSEIEPILDKTIAVKVYADASESIEVY